MYLVQRDADERVFILSFLVFSPSSTPGCDTEEVRMFLDLEEAEEKLWLESRDV